MGHSALIFSGDERAVRLLRSVGQEFSIETDCSSELSTAVSRVSRRKFDGIFVDTDCETAREFLRQAKRSRHNKKSVIFAITSVQISTSTASELGLHFTLFKPLITETVKRTMRAALGLFSKERRRHFRVPVAGTATVQTKKGAKLVGPVRDLTEGGALIECKFPIPAGEVVNLQINLSQDVTLTLKGIISWSDLLGRAGVRFTDVDPDTQERIYQYVAEESIEPEGAGTAAKVGETAESEGDPKTVVTIPATYGQFMSENEQPQNRLRAAPRAVWDGGFRLLLFDREKPLLVRGECRDISETGFGGSIEDEEITLSGPVIVSIELPGDSERAHLHAEVRRQHGTVCGLEFVGLSQERKVALRAALAHLPVV